MSFKPVRILLMSFVPLELTGAGTTKLLNLLVDFLSKKPNVKLLEVCTLASTEEKRRFDSWYYTAFKGLSLKFIHDVSPRMIRYVLERRKYYDVVLIIGCSLSSIIIALLLKLFSCVKIVQIPQLHKDFIFRDKFARFLYELRKWLAIYLINFRIVQPVLIVYSREEENMVRRFARNVVRRPLGIDLKGLESGEFSLVAESKSKDSDEKLILLHVGDIHRNKFPLFALEVMRSLKEQTDGRVELIAVGRIHQRHFRKLMEKIKEYELENNIKFTGVVPPDELLTYWKKADVFVLFSASEAGPFVVLEAMAFGVPVVATRVGMVPELEEKGMLLAADYGDKNDMAAKIIELWRNKDLRESLVKKAKSELPNYDIKYFLETVYQQLIANVS